MSRYTEPKIDKGKYVVCTTCSDKTFEVAITVEEIAEHEAMHVAEEQGKHQGHNHVNAYDEETCEALMQQEQTQVFGWAVRDANLPTV